MRRRDVIAGLLVAAIAEPTLAQQTGKVYRLAVVHPSEPVAAISEREEPFFRPFFGELRQLGYVEGQNLLVERHTAEGRTEHFAELAREVVGQNPDIIFAVTGRMVQEFKAATATIPIVGITGDPIASGIVSNLARPGGNITGVSIDAGLEILGKRLQLLREALPRVSKVGFLASQLAWDLSAAAMKSAAQRSGVALIGPPLDVPFAERQYRDAFAAMVRQGAEAVIVGDQPEHFTNRQLIVELAENARLPAIYSYREPVEIGGLMAYAFDLADLAVRVADDIGLILKGTKPGEIPYYQSSKFALVINLKTARALGLTFPPSILTRADEVIE